MSERTLTDQELAEVKARAESGRRIVGWLKDNDINDLKPMDVVSQLKNKYGEETITESLKALRKAAMANRLEQMVSRMLSAEGVTVATCDSILAALNSSVAITEAKKAELQG